MTLTGDHRVSFDPDGGDYQPETQTVKGGDCAEAPRDPAKEGYVFEGWYYTEEDGNEVKWDFKTPVHRQILCLTLVFGAALTGLAAGLRKKSK
ncbi:InlB B-repeat-containing protein [Anaerostipes sp.]|uniref:InlB B-repeat-containing protein n=1 Tax=Anaerostipes sp. TaxID=1872530 RepID=UPI00257E25FE|nr:InlB B-repeat-containing protein [Anaerostipes sp.]